MKKLRIAVSLIIATCISFADINASFADDISLKRGEVSISQSYGESSTIRRKGESESLDEVARKLEMGIKNLETQIDISEYGISTDSQRQLLDKVIRGNPDIFYTRGWSYSYNPSSGMVFGITPSYDYEKSVIESMKAEIERKLSLAIAEIEEPNMTPLEKVLAVHEYLVLNIEYDERSNVPIESHSIYGALVNRVAVCEGYAELLTLMLEKLGEVESIVVVSEEMLHAWSMVVLDGENYHIDATWNDPTPDRKGYVRYDYLLVPDSVIAKDHQWDESRYPIADSHKYSFLWELENPRYSLGIIRHNNKATGRIEEIVLEKPAPLEEKPIPETEQPIEAEIPEEIELPVEIETPEPDRLVANPYINGYADGTFRPGNSVRRAEIAAMISKLLELSQTESRFPDVSRESWAFKYIGAMQDSGLMKGDQYGNFKPEASLTRAEMATIASAIYDGTIQNQSVNFKDTRGHWGEKAIEKMARAGILKGYTDGSFMPNREVSRAEAVAILNRLSNLKLSEEELKTETNPFVDIDSSHWAYSDIIKATSK